MDFPVLSDCAMPPDQALVGDERMMIAIMRGHYGEPHTCEGTCGRYRRERLLTLRERVHEMMHVGDPHLWACSSDLYSCPLLRPRGVVEKVVDLFAGWLVEQDVEVDVTGWLATEARR